MEGSYGRLRIGICYYILILLAVRFDITTYIIIQCLSVLRHLRQRGPPLRNVVDDTELDDGVDAGRGVSDLCCVSDCE